MTKLFTEEVVQKTMRKFTFSVLVLSALGACASTPNESEREEELYMRLRYLRAAFETSYADHNAASLDTVSRELKEHARRDLELFGRDLRTGSLWKKEIAAFVLAFSGTEKAQELLIEATRDPDMPVRGIAIASLGLLSMADTDLDIFRRNLKSEDHWYLRQAALYGLRYQLKEDAPVNHDLRKEVEELLGDNKMDVRNEALIVLRRMKATESIPAITAILKDSNPHVRQSSAMTLAVFGSEGRSAVPSLIEALRDEDTKVVEAAWSALSRITGNDFDRTYERWRDWFKEEEARYEYICPDHPQTSFESPGECPTSKCLKKLVRTVRPEIYLCPEHPDIQIGHRGRCSVCHRKMVALRPVYRCPSHPDSSSVIPGTCPSCGKELVPEEKEYSCPTHPEVEAPRPGKCSRCEKDLEALQK